MNAEFLSEFLSTESQNTISMFVIGGNENDIIPMVTDFSYPDFPLKANLPKEKLELLDFLFKFAGKDVLTKCNKYSVTKAFMNRPLIGMKCDNAYGIFFKYYDAVDAKNYFNYEGALPVVTVATEEARIIIISLYENRKTTAKVVYNIAPTDEEFEYFDDKLNKEENLEHLATVCDFDPKKFRESFKSNSFMKICNDIAIILRLPTNKSYSSLLRLVDNNKIKQLIQDK